MDRTPASLPSRPSVRPIVERATAVEYAAGDETLLTEDGTVVRVAVLAERFVSFGVGIPPTAPFLARARAERVPTVPRRTGGTGLLHDPGDLAWAVALPRRDPRVGTAYTRAYDRLGAGVVRWLATRGIESRWEPAPGLAEEYCTLGSRGWVLASAGSILGGAAQHVVHDRLLHHGTISTTVDRPAIDRIFGLPEGGPSRRLAGVADLGLRAASAVLARELLGAIAAALSAAP